MKVDQNVDHSPQNSESITCNSEEAEEQLNNIKIKKEYDLIDGVEYISEITIKPGSMESILYQKPNQYDVYSKSLEQKPDLVAGTHAQTGKTPTKRGYKQHKCNRCEKSFGQQSNLIRHLRTHTGKKPFKCNVCLMSFSQLVNLKMHILIHIGVKPHKCDLYNKSFTQKSNLKSHMVIHIRDTPYKCHICQKLLQKEYKRNLEIHPQTLIGTPSYKSSVCQCFKSFSQTRFLKSHVLLHAEDNHYECDVCHRGFKRKKGFSCAQLGTY